MGKVILEMHRLLPHPATPANGITGVSVEVTHSDRDGDFLFKYIVFGADYLALPEGELPRRCDRLWDATCFELFVRPAGLEAYFEFNFSPSTQWAAYQFDRYREGMRDLALARDPRINRGFGNAGYVIEVGVDLAPFPGTTLRLALAAVIEETDGTKSYWALAHPPGKPDFHHKDCFALELGPPAKS